MMTRYRILICLLGGMCLSALLPMPDAAAAGSAPVVSNVVAVQRPNSFLVDVTYDVSDADGDAVFVSMLFSPDGGATWPVLCASVTGAVGPGILPGVGHAAVWDARADLPGRMLAACSIRVVASDEPPYPYFAAYFKSAPDGSGEVPLAAGDTIGFGEMFRLRWQATAPAVAGMDPALLASLDTVYPFDDGILGYRHFLADGSCDPLADDCWQPRLYDEATGDSISYFGLADAAVFYNDGSGTLPQSRLLPNGPNRIYLDALDVQGLTVEPARQPLDFIVNFDPETIILDGQSDWAHPEDPEVYPYYIELNDPAQTHHPFRSGERIPDRTYVVFKALGRDDPRDGVLDPGFKLGFTGYFDGVRSNAFGGTYSFRSDAARVNLAPAWEAPEFGGWYADTLGFLTGPSTTFRMAMQSVDEHGRRDGTPATLSFAVGYPPCVQCVEVLPKSSLPSSYGPDVACVDDPADHPCFQGVSELRISQTGVGAGDLELLQPAYLLVDKQSLGVRVADSAVGEEADNYVIDARLYRMSVLLHGRDDPREAWAEGVRRIMGWRYQIDHACDPFNLIQEGGGNDDLLVPTWGEPGNGLGLRIDPATGLWRLEVDVAVPVSLFIGADNYLLLLTFIHAGGDPVLAQAIFDATTRQLGAGTVSAVALDQTVCGSRPVRPAKYTFFRGVRPPVAAPPGGGTWRDCFLNVPDIKDQLSLGDAAMASRDGSAVSRGFRIVVETATGDYTCEVP